MPDDIGFLKENKLLDRLKDKEDPKNPDKGDYLLLKKPELDRDGNRNEPIKIYDKDGTEWGDERLLGNGTRVVAKLKIVDWGVASITRAGSILRLNVPLDAQYKKGLTWAETH